MRNLVLTVVAVLIATANPAQAQMPPPPIPPLEPVPVPADNPLTTAKINLGKVLFWEEQLSSTNTVACGTCHAVNAGGSDARSTVSNVMSIHPGPDDLFNTADDVVGSPGVPSSQADGRYVWDDFYGYLDQVTGRHSPPAVNAAYAPELFWDGRAGDTFSDPVSGELLVSSGAALEKQAVGPPLSDVEMSHRGQDWAGILTKLTAIEPLILSPEVPTDLADWIDGRSYPQLFVDAFGTAEISAGRIGMAIASYERTLISDQTPHNDAASGNRNALTPQERRGRGVFFAADCGVCHGGALLTDHQFKYIGVVPQDEDVGRFAVTGRERDRGRFKTPSLLNIELRAPYMHDGSQATLSEVIDFYDRGGDFGGPNKDPNVRTLNLSEEEKADLLAFLTRPLTDQRVANQTGPFTVPELYSASDRVPVVATDGTAGSAGFIPEVVAIEPPLLGNPSFTVGLFNALGGASSTLIIDTSIPGAGPSIPDANNVVIHETVDLTNTEPGSGHASVSVALPINPTLRGVPLYGRWYVVDPAAANSVAVSPHFEFRMFGVVSAAADRLFASSFE